MGGTKFQDLIIILHLAYTSGAIMQKTVNNIHNPFFRLPLSSDPDKYYGSTQTIERILEAISGRYPAAVELIGLPGVGKSTMLHYLSHPEGAILKHQEQLQWIFRDEHYKLFPVLVEFKHLPTHIHPFSFIRERFHDSYPNYKKRVSPKMEAPLPILENNSRNGEDIDILEHEILELNKARIRPILLIDDFDLAFEKLSLKQTTRLRPLRAFVSFVLGTEKPLNKVNPEASSSPFFSTLLVIKVAGLTKVETKQLLIEPAKDVDICFPDKDVDFVAEKAGNHPYLLILAGRHLWDLREQLGILNNENQPLTEEQRNLLMGRLKEDLLPSFNLYFKRLSPEEIIVLTRISSSTEATIPADEYKSLASLFGKAVVKRDQSGNYRPFSQLFAEYISEESGITADKGAEKKIRGLEAKLYEYLKQNTNRICSFEELSQEVWNDPYEGNEIDIRRKIQVTVSRIRSKMRESRQYEGEEILSFRDKGYRLITPLKPSN